MLHHLHRLLRKKGTHELLLLFAVIAVSVDQVSSGMEELNANFRCVSGKMDDIKGQEGGRGQQDVTVDGGGQRMVKLEGTPKKNFRAMVQDANHLDYELVVDYEANREEECKTTKTQGSKAMEKAVVEEDEIEGVKKEDAKDDGHEQGKSAPSHYLTQSASAENSEVSGEKKEEAVKKEETVQDNGYEKMGSTLLYAAGIIVPDFASTTMSEAPGKKSTTTDGYEKLDDVVVV